MANRYWVGGTGNCDGTTTQWSATDGGGGGATYPTTSDDVFFTSLSNATAYVVTLTATLPCLSISIDGPLAGNITFAGSAAITCAGSWYNGTAVTRTYSGTITLTSTTSGKTITTNGISWGNQWTFSGVGGVWTLQDNTSFLISITAGHVDFNGKTVALTNSLNITSTANAILTTGAATVTQGGNLNVGSAAIINAGSLVSWTTNGPNGVDWGGHAIGGTYILNSGNGAALTNTGGTFVNVNLVGANSGFSTQQMGSNHTITGTLTIAGFNAVNCRYLIRSTVRGVQRTLTCGTLVCSNANFQDIVGAGAASWNLVGSTGEAGDLGGNSGITFISPISCYWVHGASASYNSTDSRWFTASGGATPARIPLPQDTRIFDANSFAAGGKTVVENTGFVGTTDFTGVTNSPAYTPSGSALIFVGSFILDSGLTLNAGVGTYQYEGRGSSVLTSAGKSWQKSFWIEAPGGTLTLTDALTLSGAGRYIYLFAGTFTVGANNITGTGFVCTGTLTRALNAGSGTWTLGLQENVSVQSSGLTFNGQTATWRLTGAISSAFNVLAGAQTYYRFEIVPTSGSFDIRLGADALNPTFTTLHIDATALACAVKVTSGRTITVGNFTRDSGTNVITMDTVSGTGTWTITKTGGNYIDLRYMSITRSIASPASTFYAILSTNGGTNTNWTFVNLRYWVGGTANWDAATTTNWSSTSGGAGGSSVPTITDDVFFDAASNATGYTVTITATANCRNFSAAAPASGNLVLNSTGGTITVSGNLSAYAGLLLTSAVHDWTFSATSARTIDANNVGWGRFCTFGGTGTYQLLSNWRTLGGTALTTVSSGATLDLNGFTVTSGNGVTVSSGGILTMGSGSISTNSINISTGATVSAASMTSITVAAAANFGGKIYGGLVLINTTAASQATDGGNTFNNLTIQNGTTTCHISFSGNNTISGTLTIAGNNNTTGRIIIRSSIIGVARTLTAAVVVVSNANFQDIVGAGAGSWNLSAITGLSGDWLGNSGITFTTPMTCYWVSGTGNYSNSAKWMTTSGGAIPARVPLAQDTPVFDANSFTAGSQTVTLDIAGIKELDFSLVTNSPTIAHSSTGGYIFGSITWNASMTISYAQRIYLQGRGSHLLTSNGKAFPMGIDMEAFGGTYTLADAFSCTAGGGGGFTLIQGTLASSTFNFTCTVFLMNASNGTRIANMGSGTWTMTGGSFQMLTGTVNAGTSTLRFTGALIGAIALNFATGTTLYNLEIATTGAFDHNFNSSITISNNFNIDASVAVRSVKFTAGTTITVGNVTRDAGTNVITFDTTTGTSTFSMTKTGGGTITLDYMSITRMTGNPDLTWLMTNSTNGGSNTRVYFGTFPTTTRAFIIRCGGMIGA